MSNKRRDLAKGSIKNVLSVFGQIYYNKFIENKAKIESKEMKKAVSDHSPFLVLIIVYSQYLVFSNFF